MPPRKNRARGDAAEQPPAKKSKTAPANGSRLPQAALAPTVSQEAPVTLDGNDPSSPATNAKPVKKSPKTVVKKPTHAESDLQKAYLEGAISFEAHIDNAFRSSAFPPIDDAWIDEKLKQQELTPSERAHWSREDEQELRLGWVEDPLHAKLVAETESTLRHLRLMWKLCCQYLRCLPSEIIGDAVVGSQYRLSMDQTGQMKIPAKHSACLPYSPFWPLTACTAFSEIIWHPLWKNGHVASLVLAIQFAVITRTDDRRSWDFENPTDSRFIDDLRVAIDAERDLYIWERSSIGELCRKVHESKPAKQKSDWYTLFDGIYRFSSRSGRKTQPTASLYAVATEDFISIKSALRDIGGYGLPSPVTLDMYRAAYGFERKPTSAPCSIPRVIAVLDTVALNYKRRQLVHQRVKDAAASVDDPDFDALAKPSPGLGPELVAAPIAAVSVVDTADAQLPRAAPAATKPEPVSKPFSEPAPTSMNTLGASQGTLGVVGRQVPPHVGTASAVTPSPASSSPTSSMGDDFRPAALIGALAPPGYPSPSWPIRPARRPAPRS